MQNVPKIVRERLKAGAPVVGRPLGDPAGKADAHPDADLLTAFAERSLTEFERAGVLDHLSRCGDCREVVALALPASEEISGPVVTTVRTPARGWLTWPALRWGLVAAGVVAIASVGVLRHQNQRAAVTLDKSAPVEVAVNEPKKQELDRPVDAAPKEKEKLQSPATPVPSDSLSATNSAVDSRQSAPRPETSPVGVVSQQIKSGTNSYHGGTFAANALPHGPRLANQVQLQNNAQNQAPVPAPPSAYSKQAAASDGSANTGAAAASETVEVASAAPAISPESRNMDSLQGRDQSMVDRAKAPVASAAPAPSARSAYGAAGAIVNQPYTSGSFGGPIAKAGPGKMVGYVVDPSGALVANVRITVTPFNSGGATTAVTDSQGAWLIAGLPTGSYKAQAEATGFKTTVLDLNYDANQPSLYRFNLDVGSVAETVEVTGGNAQVQIESANIGGAVNGRNMSQLVALSPGTTTPLVPKWTISASGDLQRSFDQGKTWQAVDVNANPAYFAYAANSETSLQISAETSPTKKSKDKASGKLHKQAVAALTFRAVTAAGSDVWAGGSGGALYHSADAGGHWSRVVPASAGATLTGDIISLNFPDAQHGKLATSTSEIWATADGGQTWRKWFPGL